MTYRILLAAVLFQGISGVAGGYGLVSDPSGRAVGLPIVWLEGTPFADYLLPGLILLFGLGLFPLAVAWGLWHRRRWARSGAVIVGTALVIWILVEVVLIGYQPEPPLQVAYGALGLAILGLALSPSVRERLS